MVVARSRVSLDQFLKLPEEKPAEWRGTDRIDVSDVLPKFELTVEELFSSLRVP